MTPPPGTSAPETRPDDQPPIAPPRLDVLRVSLILFALALVVSLPVLRGSGRDVDVLGNLVRFVGRFLPPDPSALRPALAALVETARMAVLATAAAIVLSIPVGAAAARNLAPRPLVVATRFALNGIRTLPSLVWALLAVAVLGANPLAGVIALAAYSVGYLGKFYADAFESVDAGVARALRALGAGKVQAFQHGLWPHARPLVWSHALWMLEYNLRSAAIIGYVGAGGLGTQLHAYQEFQQWDRFATVLLVLLGLVTALDVLGERVRARLTVRGI